MQELCTVTHRTHTHTLRHWERRLTQNPATQREKTYSKSSNTEREDLLKIQQHRERRLPQNPATQRYSKSSNTEWREGVRELNNIIIKKRERERERERKRELE